MCLSPSSVDPLVLNMSVEFIVPVDSTRSLGLMGLTNEDELVPLVME